MKRQGCSLYTVVLGMIVVLAVSTAHAQIGSDVLKVRIPFNFSVGTQTFPAGEYSLKPLLPHTLLLRNQAGQVLTTIATNTVESTEVPRSVRVVFNGYGGQYFLAQIWKAGDSTGQALVKSPTEVEMARKHPSGQQVALQIATPR